MDVNEGGLNDDEDDVNKDDAGGGLSLPDDVNCKGGAAADMEA